jgi:hypothetical protein
MVSLSKAAYNKAIYGETDYGDYVIDTETKNLSFIKMFKYLKERGIKNNKFFLRLYDKSLKGVDPHRKNLTEIQKTKILTEITKNPYYYLREVVKIVAPGGTVKFELHPGNLAITWAIFNNFDLICLLSRQRGKTISIAAALNYIYNFSTKNTNMLFANKSLGDAKNNLKRFKDITLHLPKFIQDALTDRGDTDNLESVHSIQRNNKIDVNGQPISEEQADKQGYLRLCINSINCWNPLTIVKAFRKNVNTLVMAISSKFTKQQLCS